MKIATLTALAALTIGLGFSGLASGASPAATATPAAKEAEQKHKSSDVARHRAIASAHEAAAKCLESGKTEQVCHEALRTSCKGLAIGKYCGMKHEH